MIGKLFLASAAIDTIGHIAENAATAGTPDACLAACIAAPYCRLRPLPNSSVSVRKSRLPARQDCINLRETSVLI
jgi:hypothetical protein